MPPPRSPKTKPGSKQPPRYREYPPRPPAGPPEVVDPIWLLKAIAAVVVLALACGYASLCLLLYQGQWQLILHPKPNAAVPAAIDATPIELIRFGTDDTGVPQLTGWRIPADPGARYARWTVLLLPSGDGSLADALPTLTSLHTLGVNLFAIDYRGYGQSAATHPNQQRMTQDADAAWQYLTGSRHLSAAQIIPYGIGVGASLATHLAAEHADAPALILDAPGPDPLTTVLNDPRTHLLPVRWLLHDRFPLVAPLATLQTPKLLLSVGPMHPASVTAASPKMTVESGAQPGTVSTPPAQSIARFFDQYLPGSEIAPLPQPSAR